MEELSRQIEAGLTPAENNPIKGKMRAVGEGEYVDLRNKQGNGRWEQATEEGKRIMAAVAVSAGGLSTRSGGFMHAARRMPRDIPVIGGRTFIDIKKAIAVREQDVFKEERQGILN